MRLSEPGLYVARDGRVAMSYITYGQLVFAVRRSDSSLTFINAGLSGTEGEWQRIDLAALQWPELPPKPKLFQCLVRWTPDANNSPSWSTFSENHKGSLEAGCVKYTVVPHPDNDPEAVAMIEAARKEAGDA